MCLCFVALPIFLFLFRPLARLLFGGFMDGKASCCLAGLWVFVLVYGWVTLVFVDEGGGTASVELDSDTLTQGMDLNNPLMFFFLA